MISGYDKLRTLDINADGVVSSTELSELSGLSLWFDNGDAIVQNGELRTVQPFDLASINVNYEMLGGLMCSSAAMINGKKVRTEDVWFSAEEAVSASAVTETLLNKTKARLN